MVKAALPSRLVTRADAGTYLQTHSNKQGIFYIHMYMHTYIHRAVHTDTTRSPVVPYLLRT